MDLKEQTKAPAETETRTGSYVGNPGIEAGVAPVERAPRPIEAGVDIGHVHLRAGDLGKIKDFYVGILGFDVVVEAPTMLFVSAGGYHHHLGFNVWESKGGSPPPPGTTGLYTWRSATRHAPGLATPCAGCATRATPSTASTTPAPTKRSTCATRKRTASSWAGTGRRKNGTATRTATTRWATGAWTSPASCARASTRGARARPAPAAPPE